MPRITVLKRCILYTVESSEISHFLQHSLTILEVLAILFSTSNSTPAGGEKMRAVFFKDCSQEVFGNAR